MQQAKLLILLVGPRYYIHDVTNINVMNNKRKIKGNCERDLQDVVARAFTAFE